MEEAAEKAVLKFEDVTVSFDSGPVLRNISFEALEGESRIILGAAGSGKTVLLKTALGLARPERGSVYVFGQDITKMSEHELFDIRSRIGMLFQESALFDSLTIEENVAYPLLNQSAIRCAAEEVRPRVEQALKFVELEETLNKNPSELSGGMRRRAAIARAVVTEPPLILYDSPTAGLDPITAYTIIALIVKERDLSNTTSLMVTHRYQDGNMVANFRYNPADGRLIPWPAAAARTKFMVLREGSLVFKGSQSELEACRDPYIASFVKRQSD